MSKHRIIYLFLLPLTAFHLSAQWETDSVYDYHTQKGISAVYNLEFPEATKEFNEMVRLRPDHPAGHFFLAMVDWEQIAIDIDNESYDDAFYDKLDQVIDVCNKRLKDNSDDVTALFFKGGAIGFRARLRANRDHWLRAANDGRLALPIIQKIRELQPDNYDVLLGTGIYDYFAEVAPEKYPILKPIMIFFPNGDKKRGIESLRLASEKAKYAAVEAAYCLMQVYYSYEHKPANALPLAIRLHARFPNNPQFERSLGRCYVQLDVWPEVFRIFTDINLKFEKKLNGYNHNCPENRNIISECFISIRTNSTRL